jgi:hypothetical protein
MTTLGYIDICNILLQDRGNIWQVLRVENLGVVGMSGGRLDIERVPVAPDRVAFLVAYYSVGGRQLG